MCLNLNKIEGGHSDQIGRLRVVILKSEEIEWGHFRQVRIGWIDYWFRYVDNLNQSVDICQGKLSHISHHLNPTCIFTELSL